MKNIKQEIMFREKRILKDTEDLEALRAALRLLDGDTELVEPKKKRVYRSRRYAIHVDKAVENVFDAMPGAVMSTPEIYRQVQAQIPKVKKQSVGATISKMTWEGRLVRVGRGVYRQGTQE